MRLAENSRGRKNRGGGEKGEGVGTFHVPGRLIKFQKLKHHLLRVFSRLVVGPEKSAERVATPSKGSNIFFIKRGLPRKVSPVWTVASHLGRPEKSLSLSLSPSLFSPTISLWLYGLVWLTIAVSILVPIHRIVKQCGADYSI